MRRGRAGRFSELPDKLARRLEELERRLGRRVILRACRWPDPDLRGRIHSLPGAIVLEYRDDVAGFFWHYDIIAELITHAQAGVVEGEFRDSDRRGENSDRGCFGAL